MKFDKVLTYILLLLALSMPGFGYLYLSNQYVEMEILILILASVFHSIPIFIVGLFCARMDFDEEDEESEDDDTQFVLLASFYAILIYFIAIGVFYMSEYVGAPFKSLIVTIYSVMFAALFLKTLAQKRTPDKKKSKKKKK